MELVVCEVKTGKPIEMAQTTPNMVKQTSSVASENCGFMAGIVQNRGIGTKCVLREWDAEPEIPRSTAQSHSRLNFPGAPLGIAYEATLRAVTGANRYRPDRAREAHCQQASLTRKASFCLIVDLFAAGVVNH